MNMIIQQRARGVADDHSIEKLVIAARTAQCEVKSWSQERVDKAVASVAWHLLQDRVARDLIEKAIEETGIGDCRDSFRRLHQRTYGTLCDLHGTMTIGLVEDDVARGIQKFAKPIGVIGVVSPSTAPVAAIATNVLTAIKTRNSVIFCPNPSVRLTCAAAVDVVRQALASVGAPVDLAQSVKMPDRFSATALTKEVDLVVATGGVGTVRRAYESGRPAFGGGPGNAVVIIDETADLDRAAEYSVEGKAFDNGTSCSAESSLIISESIWTAFLSKLADRAAYVCDPTESRRLRKVIWPNGTLSRSVVGRSALHIAELAGIHVASDTRVLVSELGQLFDDPLAREKLSPVLGVTRFSSFDEAVEIVCLLTALSGRGHSCGIYTNRSERVDQLASVVEVSRIMVNQSTGSGNSGSLMNGMPFTSTVSCGTWGGSPLNENVNWRHFLNYTWVSRPIDRPTVSWNELMSPYTHKLGNVEGEIAYWPSLSD